MNKIKVKKWPGRKYLERRNINSLSNMYIIKRKYVISMNTIKNQSKNIITVCNYNGNGRYKFCKVPSRDQHSKVSQDLHVCKKHSRLK